MLSVRTNSAGTAAYLRKVRYAFQTGQHMHVLSKEAQRTLADVTRKTPKGYTGLTRQKWAVDRVGNRGYIVANPSPVMKFLEDGTKAHGPKFAKALFIPKNRTAALQGPRAIPSLTYGIDYIFTKRVKGIKKMGIVRAQRKITSRRLKAEMQIFLTRILTA